jgi:hypothetical protein
VAKQITQMFGWTIKRIQPCELVIQAWDKDYSDEEAPYVSYLQTLLYRLRSLASLSAVLEDPSDRRNYLYYMLHVLYYTKSWNDFNGIILIFGGLTNSSVHRLSVWEDIEEEISEELEVIRTITNPHRNSTALRAAMEEASPICQPYINIFLRDLIFSNDGNASFKSDLSGTRVNKRKAELSAGVVRKLQQLVRKATHEIKPDPELQLFLRSCPSLIGVQLDAGSRWSEPQHRARPDTKPEFMVPPLPPGLPSYSTSLPWQKRTTSVLRSRTGLVLIFVVALLAALYAF